MAVFEPKSIKAILKQSLEGKEKKEFDAKWDSNVNKRVSAWQKKIENQSKLQEQLMWEAGVVEYVDFLHKQTSVNGNSSNKVPRSLKPGIPLLGPKFTPPSFLHIGKRSASPQILPETSYLIPITIIHPFFYPTELAQCPQCGSSDILWDGWTATGAREVHGLRREERALGYQQRCKDCKEKYGKNGSDVDSEPKKGYCFATTSRIFWEKKEHWMVPRSVPYFLSRTAVTHDLFDLIVEIRPSSTSAGLAGHIKQLHLLEYWQETRDYLTAFGASISHGYQNSFFSKCPKLKALSAFDDVSQYNGNSISSDLITDLYREFVSHTRQGESTDYCKTRTARSISSDNTFKSANKAVVLDKERNCIKMMKGGINSILNEDSETLSWRFCQSASPAEVAEMLSGIVTRCSALGVPVPESAIVDNCCMVRNKLVEAVPGIRVYLDVFHFVMRYTAVIVNGTKNVYQTEVAKDIRDAILSSPATKGRPATYWSQSEQEKRLVAAYKKWDDHGNIWTSSASKVHSDQLNHVKKGCLARHRQDICMDGSRIEGSHKGWNSLQRAQPSGLENYSYLAHDYVHRRNIRIAGARLASSTSGYSNPFVSLTGGSHHINLIGSVAASFNNLVQKTKANIPLLPLLPTVDSDEVFGLVPSAHNETFGGLFTIKAEDEDGVGAMFEEIELRADELADPAAQSIIGDLGLARVMGSSATEVVSESSSKRKSRPEHEEGDGDLESIVHPSKRSKPSTSANLSSFLGLSSTSPSASPSASPICCGDAIRREQSLDVLQLEPELEHESRDLNAADSDGPSQEAPPRPMQIPKESQVASFFSQAGGSSSQSARDSGPSSKANPSHHRLQHPSTFDLLPSEALTRSQKLYLASTHTNPLSQAISTEDEYFLFMDLRAEHQWTSYGMNARKWVQATHAYNEKLSALCKSRGSTAIFKTPRALMDKLSEVETKIQARITKNNFISKSSGTETFWKKHCMAVPLFVKDEPNAAGQQLLKRKSPACLRCKTLMYPGPTGHAGNHKKGYCADGVAQKEKEVPADDRDRNPMWPQPAGIFKAGTSFHVMNFLKTVRELYDKVADQSIQQSDYSLEDEAFSEMLHRRTEVKELREGTGQILFRLYNHLHIEGCPNTESMIVEIDGVKYLQVNSLS